MKTLGIFHVWGNLLCRSISNLGSTREHLLKINPHNLPKENFKKYAELIFKRKKDFFAELIQ